MKTVEEYEPFDKEWEFELMKFSKTHLIDLFRESAIQNKKIIELIDEIQMSIKLKEDKLETCLIETLGKKTLDKDYYILGWEQALTELKKRIK